MRPIHDAAAALDGVADDATPDEIADAATVALKRLSEGIMTLEISDRAAARQILQWKTISANLRSVTAYYTNQIAARLFEANDGKPLPVVIESDNGEQVVCTPKYTVRRSEVKRDELIEAVERLTNNPIHRLDPNGDGELLDYDVAKVRLMKKAFRMEPRWSELKKLGINDDEFCRKEPGYSLDVRKGASL
jgi:hypothetical protein